MNRVSRPFLTLFVCLLFGAFGAVGCGGEEEETEQEAAASDVSGGTSSDVEPASEAPGDKGESETDVEVAETDASSGDVQDSKPNAGEIRKLEAQAREKAKRKKAFFGESGELKGIPIEPPAPWRRVVCDGENECVVGADFTGGSLVQILSAVEEGQKLKLTVKDGTNLSSLGLLEVFQDQLEELKLENLPSVDDIQVIENLPLLTSLELTDLPLVTDIGSLSRLGKLTNFKMEGLGCVKLDPLGALRGLKELRINMQQRVCAVDMSALGGMGALERLVLHTPNLGNLDSIEGAGALKEIFLWGSVRNLAPLAKLRNLETLTLHASPVQDLSALSLIPNLKTLKLQAGYVWNYKGLLKARKLKYLHVTEAQSLILENVKILRQLDGLTLHRGKPKNWTALSQLPWLKQLDVSFTNFSDVSLLKLLPKLRSFGCAGCNLKNGMMFSELTELEEVNIAGARGGPTLIQLSKMPKLQKLTIRRRQFGRTALRRLVKANPQVRVVYATGRYQPLAE